MADGLKEKLEREALAIARELNSDCWLDYHEDDEEAVVSVLVGALRRVARAVVEWDAEWLESTPMISAHISAHTLRARAEKELGAVSEVKP